MLTTTSIDIPVKPRVLIADDSRIVRATLIKHIQGMFDFREALNGEEAWETLLVDPSIKVVITDLTMPKLDGFGLLTRIRSSEIARIRTLPVVVVSGSDEQSERDRAKAAGATDLITKGIGTAQLLSRLDILAKLVNTQRDFERSLEVLAKNAAANPVVQLTPPDALDGLAEKMLSNALRMRRNFVMLNVVLGLKHTGLDGQAASPPASIVAAIGQSLQRTIRQTDRVAQTGEAEFTLVTGNIHLDTARNFAQRICRVIANANTVRNEHMSFIACCGVVALAEQYPEAGAAAPAIASIKQIAHRRALLGLNFSTTGVVGPEEEKEFFADQNTQAENKTPVQTSRELEPVCLTSSSSLSFYQPEESASTMSGQVDMSTLVNWIKQGKKEKVIQHMNTLPQELRPFVELLLKEST